MLNKRTIIILLLILGISAPFFPSKAVADAARDKFYEAENAWKSLKANPKQRKYRDRWLNCIDRFQRVYRNDPKGPWAAAALFRTGNLYGELYRYAKRSSDRKEAVDLYQRILKRFPESRYTPKAKAEIVELVRKESLKKLTRKKSAAKKNASSSKTASTKSKTAPTAKKKGSKPKPVTAKADAKKTAGKKVAQKAVTPPASVVAGKSTKKRTGKHVTVGNLRYWSNPNYTRIVIDAEDEAPYYSKLLKKDPSINKPQRLFIDLNGTRLSKGIKKFIPINDDLLKDVRAGQYKPDTVRVVVDIKSFDNYKIFSLKNPFRIVLDIYGKSSGKKGRPKPAVVAKKKKETAPKTKIKAGALARQLALGVKTIVIDAGHGGRDSGALGYKRGVKEKDVALSIAQKLAKKVKAKLGCNVILTRNSDVFLTLEERTAIANTKNADLFISIHTNAARNKGAYGIETFFLNLATDDDSISVAARENATSRKNISDLQSILTDLMQNAKINESSRLARFVQNSLYGKMKKKYSRIKNKGVKQAPFYVLLGARMPAILIETSFISNKRECARLTSKRYQDELCSAIVDGISGYIKATAPTANLNYGSGGGKS